jgi:hypothetical protein
VSRRRPFDGWNIPAGRSAVVEVYPSREERNGDQHDAYSAAAWRRRADRNGSLAVFLNPSLATPDARWHRSKGGSSE